MAQNDYYRKNKLLTKFKSNPSSRKINEENHIITITLKSNDNESNQLIKNKNYPN